MTREEAEALARDLYEDHPAAAPLILEAIHGATEDRRKRSSYALAWLDPAEHNPRTAPSSSALEGPTRAIADLLLACIYSTDRRERRRIAKLLQAVCIEASRIAARRAA